jgi:hypothetical protein
LKICDHSEHKKNVEVVSKTKIADEGAGQIIVVDKIAYIAHMVHEGITIVDVSNPNEPEVLSKIKTPKGTHSHKVQVTDDIMIINNERYKDSESWEAGVRIFDVSDPRNPKEIHFFETPGKGVHRMWFVDGRYAHITPTQEGYTNQIYMILDLKDPRNPKVVSKWWIDGMWEAGGEKPTWDPDKRVRAHGPPIDIDNKVYLGWTDGGFTILDISDMANPKQIAYMNWCPPYGGLTHTVLPLPERDLIVVSDEAFVDNCNEPEKYVWLVDVRNESNPIPVSTIQVEDEGFCEKGGRFGPHNLHENRPGSLIDDQLIYITYFNGGLRIVDIQDKYRPKEVGYFIPEKPENQVAIQTNDVYVDSDGLIHIVDRFDGNMYILKYNGPR